MGDKHRIFVFGSNLAGIHGKGAALHAKVHYRAVPGRGIGHHGHSYAIPTKNGALRPLPLHEVGMHIDDFITYAHLWPSYQFNVTQVGCGLAGFTQDQIVQLFTRSFLSRGTPDNCWYDPYWEAWMGTWKVKYWEGPI